ncbi:MAG: hypothetical protein H6713_06560 [Myxococcales bacterium]|nr:hypothetical protein [Myxococcales bacterium]
MKISPRARLLGLALLLCAPACGDDGGGSESSITTASSTSAATEDATAGPDATTEGDATTATGGTQGDATEGATESSSVESCAPGETRDCYTGPLGTEGVGLCAAGLERCQDDMSWGPCEGEVLPVAETCATPEDDDCDGAVDCPLDGFHVWSALYLATQYSSGDALAIGPQDRVVVGGQFLGTFFPGAETHSASAAEEQESVYVVAYATDGDPEWSVSFTDDGQKSIGALAVDGAGNVFFTGHFQQTLEIGADALQSQLTDAPGEGNLYLGKLAPDGAPLWGRAYPTPSASLGVGLAAHATGDVFLHARHGGDIDLGGGPLPGTQLVARISADGQHVWSRGFAGAAVDLAAGADGSPVLTGTFTGSVDFGGGPLDAQGLQDIFIAKLDPDGGHLWSAGYSASEGYPRVTDLDVDASDAVYATGFFRKLLDLGGDAPLNNNTQTEHVFAVKLTGDGAHVWSDHYGTYQTQEPTPPQRAAIAGDAEGNTLVTADFSGAVDFGGGTLTSVGSRDIYVGRYGPGGEHLWSARYGGALFQQARAIAADSELHIVLTGQSTGPLDFGGEPLENEGPVDLFVAELVAP